MKKIIVTLAVALFVSSTVYTYIYAAEKEPKKDTKAAEQVKNEGVLAEVNGTKITTTEFQQEISSIPANYRAMINANKKKFLDDIVLQELLSQEAMKKGLDKDADVVNTLNRLKKKLLAQKLLEKEVMQATTVSEDEMKKYYEDNKDSFKVPEQVNAAHILVMVKENATDEEKKAALQKANDYLKKIKGGADFSTVARDCSDCPSKAKGGELGYFSKGQMVPEFEEAAFKLKPGEVSDVVQTKFGYHIIKVIDKKEATQKTFDEVKDEIQQKLLKDKQKAAFDKYTEALKLKAKISINEDLLNQETVK